MNIPEFKYFCNPIKNAEITDVKCQSCGADENCLEGEYFDCGDNVVSVCLDCLSKGKVTVNIPNFIKKRLMGHLKETGYVQNENQAEERAESLIDELSKNPPVPWIQYNDWPVCCGEFGRYLGEWGKEEIIKHAPDGNGKQYIISILDDFSRSKIDNVDYFWDDIDRNTVVYVFECIHCSKYIAICQSY